MSSKDTIIRDNVRAVADFHRWMPVRLERSRLEICLRDTLHTYWGMATNGQNMEKQDVRGEATGDGV